MKFIVEDAALAWLEALAYAVLHSPNISPAGDTLSQREREDYTDVMIDGRLRQGLVRLNPDLPEDSR